MAERDDLLRQVQAARTGGDLAAAVIALDAHDRFRVTAARQSRELDLSAADVRRTFQPLPAFERHTAATDWLGEYEPPSDYKVAMIAEASQFLRKVPREVLADREEFQEQALGHAYTAASRYGDLALAARREFMTYVGYLTRRGASGLPQIQQEEDPKDDPAPTPLPTQVFDNFVPEQNEYNGVEGDNHDSQISSQQAPGIQAMEQQNAGGSGFGSGPERPDVHSTSMDTADGYSEVPPGVPGQIPAQVAGPAPSAPSAPNPILGENQDEGSERRPTVASFSPPDHEGFRWRLTAARDPGALNTPYHDKCASLHWPDEACGSGQAHTASVAVGYLMNAEEFTRRAHFEHQGRAEGIAVLAAVGTDLSKVARHHNTLLGSFKMAARTEDEIAWLRGYMAQVRPVLAGGGLRCEGCGQPLKPGKTGKCKNCKAKTAAKTGAGRSPNFPEPRQGLTQEGAAWGYSGQHGDSDRQFPFSGTTHDETGQDRDKYIGGQTVDEGYRDEKADYDDGPSSHEAASSLPQIQETIDSHDNPDPGGDQLNTAVMFPLNPGWVSGQASPDGQQAKEAARGSMTPSSAAVRLFGHQDALEGKQPHHKDSYPFSTKAHGQYLRAWNETAGVIHGSSGKPPIGKDQYVKMTGREDLHRHYLGVYHTVASAKNQGDQDSQQVTGSAGSRRSQPGHALTDPSMTIRTMPKQNSRAVIASQRTADTLTRPHQTTDDSHPPYNSAETTPDPFSSNEGGGDFAAGKKEGAEDRANGEKPTFSDNSSRVSPYVQGYAQGYFSGAPSPGPLDTPHSMGGDSGQAMNAGEAAREWGVAQASVRRQANGRMKPGEPNADPHENMAMHLIHTHGYSPEKTHRSYEDLKAEHDGLQCPPSKQASLRRQANGRYDADSYSHVDPSVQSAIPQHVMHDLWRQDPDGGDTEPTDADYDRFHDYVRRTHGQGIHDAYFGHEGVRRQARGKRIRVSAAFVTREAASDPDFRKAYRFAARWAAGMPLVRQGSAAFEAGLYSAIADRPAIQLTWVRAHQRQAQHYPEMAARIEAHASFTRKFVLASPKRYLVSASSGCYPVTAATSVDLITDGPGTSPDPMGSTPINGPGQAPPMGGQENPAASGGPPPYQHTDPQGHGPVAPDDVLGTPQGPVSESGPMTQTFSGRHPDNATLAPAAPNLAGGSGYSNTDASQGDPQHKHQQALAFRQRVQASLAARKAG